MPPTCVVTGLPAERFDLLETLFLALKRPDDVCPVCCEWSLKEGGKRVLCGACLTHPPAVCRTQVGFYFSGLVRQFVYDLKYHQKPEYARLLAEMMVAEIGEELKLSGVQALLPVPLFSLRRRDRGYNQAELIAKTLGKLLGLPVLNQSVFRIKATPSQTQLTVKQRYQNLKGAFVVESDAFSSFSHIALVDDVITTGATMQVLASCIQRKTKIKCIEAWGIAKTK